MEVEFVANQISTDAIVLEQNPNTEQMRWGHRMDRETAPAGEVEEPRPTE